MEHVLQRQQVEVSTGEVRTADSGIRLVVSALGSCIAVVAFDALRGVGGIAHVMLPGQAPTDAATQRLRYAWDSIAELLDQLAELGCTWEDLRFCVVGGGNVLERPDDTVCEKNIHAVLDLLGRHGLVVVARSLGGSKRRRVTLDVANGRVGCSVGGESEALLWGPVGCDDSR